MGKSRHRKNHKKKVNDYKKRIKDARNTMRNEYIKQLRAMQEQKMNDEISRSQEDTVIDVDKIDIDVDDMKID